MSTMGRWRGHAPCRGAYDGILIHVSDSVQVVDNVRAIPAPDPTQAVTPVVAIALDTKGPEIRTGLMLDGQDVTLEKGSKATALIPRSSVNPKLSLPWFSRFVMLPCR